MSATELAKKEEVQISFIERLVNNADNLAKIKEVGMVIIDSGFCPDHFKQSRDAVGVIMCIEAGRQLGMSWMQALSDLYPVKGRVGMMGDASVALIMGSGVLEYWKEETKGVYPEPEYTHIIISKRKGWANENRTEFSVFDATTAGLMGKDIYKKYGKRMLAYRAKGFHARDYYPEIMKGMKTVEELSDYDFISAAGEIAVETKGGKKLVIDPKAGKESEDLSSGVVESIDKKNDKNHIQDAEVIQEQAEKTDVDGKIYTVDELSALGPDILSLAEKILPEAKFKLLNENCGKRTNKKFRDCILAFQEGTIDQWLMSAMVKKDEDKPSEVFPPEGPPIFTEPIPSPEIIPQKPLNDLDATFAEPPIQVQRQQNIASFESEKKPEENKEEGILDIGEVPEGKIKRDFLLVHKFYQKCEAVGLNDSTLASALKGTELDGKYSILQIFLEKAKKDEILSIMQKMV